MHIPSSATATANARLRASGSNRLTAVDLARLSREHLDPTRCQAAPRTWWSARARFLSEIGLRFLDVTETYRAVEKSEVRKVSVA
jgi:hypothetical protein